VREESAEPIYPETDAFVADVDPTLMQQVFDISKRERESDIYHDRKPGDFGLRLEVAKR
jgi:hypothetical protein